MDGNGQKIRHQLLIVVLVPIIMLGILINFIGGLLISSFYSNNVYNQLKISTDVLLGGMELMESGDYSYEDGTLKKGNTDIIGAEMFYNIKQKDGIDTTVFWGDTRVLTTLQDGNGNYYVSTKADSEIARQVLEYGNDYYLKSVTINDTPYIGYYRPMVNSTGAIVGMIFAGKDKHSYYYEVGLIHFWLLVFSALAVAGAAWVCLSYCHKLERDIESLGGFLGEIEKGNLDPVLDDKLISRKDEIGEIGKRVSAMRDQLKRLVEIDPLTSLNNRRSGMKKLQRLHEGGADYTIVMCDIDFFKKINDNYGHSAGDEVLTQVSSFMLDSVKNCGFANRWGGEEFLLVYEMSAEKAVEKTTELREKIISQNFVFGESDVSVTMTFGICRGNATAAIEDNIKIADERLYCGKRNGRNKIVFE